MSYDGQYLYAGNFANSSTNGVVYRIGMDGTGVGQTWNLPGRSHDFAVLPNGNVVYFAMDNMMANTTKAPEEVMELNVSTGASTKIYDETTDFGTLITSGMGMAHTNHITYSPDLQAVTISMLFLNTVAVVSYPGGKLLATFGGTQSDFSAMNWSWEHGHDVHSDHIWIFNNNQSGNAHVLGFTYDESNKTASQTLDYNPGISLHDLRRRQGAAERQPLPHLLRHRRLPRDHQDRDPAPQDHHHHRRRLLRAPRDDVRPAAAVRSLKRRLRSWWRQDRRP